MLGLIYTHGYYYLDHNLVSDEPLFTSFSYNTGQIPAGNKPYLINTVIIILTRTNIDSILDTRTNRTGIKLFFSVTIKILKGFK